VAAVTPGVVNAYSSSNTVASAVGTKVNNTCATDALCTHLADASLAGNTIVVFTLYKAASGNTQNTPTVTTTLANGTASGDTYTHCATSGNDSTNDFYIDVFYKTAAATNTYGVTVTWSAAVTHAGAIPVQAYNVSSSGFDVCNGNASTTTVTTFNSGSITPTVSNDLLLQAACKTSAFPGSGGYTAGSQSNITWGKEIDGDGWTACAVQDGVYSVSATAITPQMTVATGSAYVSVGIAFKSATQGTAPSGFYIAHAADNTLVGGNSGSFTIYFPSTGNLLYSANQCGGSGTNLVPTGFTDTSSNTWRRTGPDVWDGAGGQANGNAFWAEGATTSRTLTVTAATSGTGDCSFWMYDIAGAAPHPLVSHRWSCVPDTNIVNCPINAGPSAAATYSPYNYLIGGTNGSGSWQIYPGSSTASGSLTISSMGVGFNSVVSTTSPSAAVFDCNTYGGETLSGPSNTCQNNGLAHFYNADNTPFTWTWGLTSSGTAIAQFSGVSDTFIGSTATRLPNVVDKSPSSCIATASGTALTCTYPTHATGNMLAIQASTTATSGNITVTDSNSNTITVCSGATCGGSTNACQAATNGCMKQFYITSLNASSFTNLGGTLTFTFPTDTFREVWLFEITGATTFDKANISNGTISAGVSTGTAVATTAANEVLVSSVLCTGGCNSGTNFQWLNYDQSANTWQGQAAEYRVVSATGSYSGVFNDSGSGTDGVSIMAFK
jgi:hypothetical protein